MNMEIVNLCMKNCPPSLWGLVHLLVGRSVGDAFIRDKSITNNFGGYVNHDVCYHFFKLVSQLYKSVCSLVGMFPFLKEKLGKLVFLNKYNLGSASASVITYLLENNTSLNSEMSGEHQASSYSCQ